MKPWHIILLCLLTVALYLFSAYNEFPNPAAAVSSTFLSGRRSLRRLKIPLPHHRNRYPKPKVMVDEALQASAKGSMALKYSRSYDSDKMDELLVYHIDYHGVTTHPTPIPKHPKP